MIAVVDQIKYVDGKEIMHSERIQAKQNFNELLEDLRVQIELKKIKKISERKTEIKKEFCLIIVNS